ncbi:probable serine/threonine-protein kinase SIS8 isoform X2 [Henckelia pumila]|uniref:probable serine/threonine-protein kinase SIS8 isoform X2 n=1 Tax=Henckelia pumila TaxID=405737 RepID=UPI003C6DC13A
MKNFLKRLHIGSNHSEDSEGSSSSSKAISGWLNSVTHRRNSSPPSPSNVPRVERRVETFDSVDSSSLDAVLDAVRHDSEFGNSRDPDVEEEHQIQLALELSAREDPEAVQIEAVKQISLGSCPPENTPAEVAAYRYWNYNALNYDDKIPDGFFDLHGILVGSTSSNIPSLIDLQGTPVSDDIHWEAILVNRAADTKLLSFEQQALDMAFKLKPDSVNFVTTLSVVQNLATSVSDHMGGPVSDPDKMLTAWRNHSYSLKANHGSMVLPLGSLTIGLARHRALLFKILADSLDIPCCLVKGQEFTGSDEVAMNIVKIDGREYIVDLMADPGTLIPSDALGAHMDRKDTFHVASSSGEITSSLEDQPEFSAMHEISNFGENDFTEQKSTEGSDILSLDVKGKQMKGREGKHGGADRSKNSFAVETGQEVRSRVNHPFPHARSPSWTEGISSPAARRMKVNDVSQLMVDAAKDNPTLAQKLHDVLLESGVVAPRNLFTQMYPEKLDFPPVDIEHVAQEKEKKVSSEKHRTKGYNILDPAFLPPLPHHGFRSRGTLDKSMEHQSNMKEVFGHRASSEYEVDISKYKNNVPVAAAAAAAAAAVASSMVVAVANANNDPKLQLPAATAATVTAAAVVATTAAVSKQYDILEMGIHSPDSPVSIFKSVECIRSEGDANATASEEGSGKQEHEGLRLTSEGERISDRSVGNESFKSDTTFDDVADCEIPWEDITLGERIGLGSYGEVYRGDWHGTEVAVKRFLDQDKIGESLEEFKSEVLLMKRLRHPNVVLFMGAVTRPPNLSIVTEFLPRGSLYRLIHRPNNQLDERRRLRMALDTARGLNYLHTCTPLIVHRDLKSPNLLVDKNWVVKVCDFGLSRMKHNTYLSSRSTAGTAEWMAPEILRNEPSNEKCDVYSFGVILWELFTLQQPWGGMNPMQVVGAVGFQHRRLEIPDNMDPVVADIIRKCWQTDPKLRPSFTEIMALLKPLQKPITSKQGT